MVGETIDIYTFQPTHEIYTYQPTVEIWIDVPVLLADLVLDGDGVTLLDGDGAGVYSFS